VGRLCLGTRDRDGATRRRHRGRQQRRDVTRADHQRTGSNRPAATRAADRRSPSACSARAARGRAAGAGTAGGGASACSRPAREPERLGEHSERSEGEERRQLPVDATQLASEAPASRAVTHMSLGGRVGPHAAVTGSRELHPDLGAGSVSGGGGLRQRDPGPYQQRLDGRHRGAQRAGQLLVRHAAHLPHQERGPLLFWEPPDVDDQPPERLAPVGLRDGVVDRACHELKHLGRWGRRPAQLVDTPVVCHPEEPGPKR
jgi:hypothetical protein